MDITGVCSYLDHSKFGVCVDIFLAVVSVVFVGTYIANTYIPVNTVRVLPSPPSLGAALPRG